MVYYGILEVCLDIEAHMPSATKIYQKEQKETTKVGGISSTIMDQKSIYNSIHKPQRSPNETLGFNHDDNQKKCAMKQEFLNSWNLQIPGIPMVLMVTSRTRSLRDPTQQDLINARTLSIYKCHRRFKF